MRSASTENITKWWKMYILPLYSPRHEGYNLRASQKDVEVPEGLKYGGCMSNRRLCFYISLVVVMLCMAGTAHAGTILSFDGSGTLGPIIGGTNCPTPTSPGCDPLGINGQTVTFDGTISSSLTPNPIASCPAGVSVCYTIPAGDLGGQIGTAKPFTTTTPSTLSLTIPGGSANDIMTVNFEAQFDSPVTAILELAPNSFNSGALINPEPFTPSPQTLIAASVPPPTINGSSVSYCEINCTLGSTILGFGGTASFTAPTTVPEPATTVLLGFGLAGLAFYRRRKRA
jgi:hypothetical protein